MTGYHGVGDCFSATISTKGSTVSHRDSELQMLGSDFGRETDYLD